MRRLIVAANISLVLAAPAIAGAQLTSGLAGGLLGMTGGGYVTLALVTAQTRAGEYHFRRDQLGWHLAPIPLGAAAGAALGASGSERLLRSLGYGAVGLAAGSALGALAGTALWSDAEGQWAGGIMGGALGLMAGAALGAATWEGSAAPGQPPLLTLRMAVGR